MLPFINRLNVAVHRIATEAGVSKSIIGTKDANTVLTSALRRYRSWSIQDNDNFRDVEDLRLQQQQSETVLEYDDLGSGASRRSTGKDQDQRVRRKVSDISRSSSPVHECRLLHSLIAEARPMRAIELGTCLGVSAAYQARALSLTPGAELHTIEGAPPLADAATANLSQLGIDNVSVHTGAFGDVLPELLRTLEGVDYVFIDGHHSGDAMRRYFGIIKPFVASGGIVVFDDLSWSTDMRRGWNIIKDDDSIDYAIDLFTIGVCQIK